MPPIPKYGLAEAMEGYPQQDQAEHEDFLPHNFSPLKKMMSGSELSKC